MIEAIWINTEKLDAYERATKLNLEGLGKLMTDIGEACKRDDYGFLKQFDFVCLEDPYATDSEEGDSDDVEFEDA